MPRSIWKGSISFGLVQIPVALYSASNRDELGFKLVDRRDLSPIGYERVNKTTGEEVPWEEVVKGYELDSGEFVVLSDADFEKANVEATHTIDIVHFVDECQIDPMYFDKPYFVAPATNGRKAYALLREVMRDEHKMAVAKVVIRTRQHLAVLAVQGAALVLNAIRFAHELRDAGELDLPGTDLHKLGVTKPEVNMAKKLVEEMIETFDPAAYKDTYRDDLLAIIEKKAETGKVAAPPGARAARARAEKGNVVDLMGLLKKSVGGTSKAPKKAPHKAHPRHKTAHKKSA